MLVRELYNLEKRYSAIKLDKFVIMPNHIHFILAVEKKLDQTIGTIIKGYKTTIVYKYNKGVREGIYRPYNKKFWQKDFYDRIIRNEKELYEIRKYIIENPLKWHLDRLHID